MAQKFIHTAMFHQHNLIVIFRAKCVCFLKGLNHAINSGNSTRYIQPRVILAYLARFPFQLGMWHQIMWFRVMQTPGFSQDHHYTNLLFKNLTAFQRVSPTPPLPLPVHRPTISSAFILNPPCTIPLSSCPLTSPQSYRLPEKPLIINPLSL